jgi:hypothetical protein
METKSRVAVVCEVGFYVLAACMMVCGLVAQLTGQPERSLALQVNVILLYVVRAGFRGA